ncbi:MULTISPECIES: AraC family transcriptional regulator [unclassified Carboxylicivirga]|uniref:AraC family transcriptional regulator n=1 Tax=Carboxylicivirga TaxID=1628153 RepID=UPI003D324F15
MKTDLSSVHREITPLTQGDCLMVFDRKKKDFDFPIHFHPEYELNLIINAGGAKRIVGDHIDYISNYELVLTGPNLFHCWEQGNCSSEEIHEVTIQFHSDLLNSKLLNRNIMKPIKDLLNHASNGILFPEELAKIMLPKLLKLSKNSGFDSFIDFLNILYDLSNARNQQILSSVQAKQNNFYNSEKIKKTYEYIQNNFRDKIKLDDIARELNMTSISFSRLIKQRTGKTFVEFLNDYRIGCASRMLLDTNENIAEVAYECGFNNLANFNRIFKKAKGCSPTQFKDNFSGVKRFY